MTQQLILDPAGAFFVNTSQFAFIDHSTGVRFEPGVHVKTKPTEWMKGQTVIKAVEPEKSEKPAKADK